MRRAIIGFVLLILPAFASAQQQSAQPDYLGVWSSPGTGCNGGYPITINVTELLPTGFYRGTWKVECINTAGAFAEDDTTKGARLRPDGALEMKYVNPDGSAGVYTLRRQGDQLVGTLVTSRGHTYHYVFDKVRAP